MGNSNSLAKAFVLHAIWADENLRKKIQLYLKLTMYKDTLWAIWYSLQLIGQTLSYHKSFVADMEEHCLCRKLIIALNYQYICSIYYWKAILKELTWNYQYHRIYNWYRDTILVWFRSYNIYHTIIHTTYAWWQGQKL